MPAVSVIIPLFNDEEWVSRALESCVAQTLRDIEVICVDDASTDTTREIVEEYARRDSRIRLVVQETNSSAFQARRVGVQLAESPYVLFLDGDDEIDASTALVAWNRAEESGADVVGFGVAVLTDDGRGSPIFERSLQPPAVALQGDEIISVLFPPDEPAQGHLWRYLWKTSLLRGAYESVPSDLRLYRANDLPIAYLSLAGARAYVSVPDRLYHYNFRRGTSGRAVTELSGFVFYLGAIDSIDSIAKGVAELAEASLGQRLSANYSSVRRSVIGNLLRYIVEHTHGSLRHECVKLLREKVNDDIELLRAALTFVPKAFDLVSPHIQASPASVRRVRHVLLTTANLRTGGVQGVVAAQARLLVDAGFAVTVALFASTAIEYELPDSVEILRVPQGLSESDRVQVWTDSLREIGADMVIDHHILYNDHWPARALAARSLGIGTIGWLHNFALRPLADSSDRTSFLVRHLRMLEQVVVLSLTDVAFWKLQGIRNVVYLPNPLTQDNMRVESQPRALSGPRIEIAWWGRLQQSTKQVRDLIEIGAELSRMSVDFRMTIIGPDGPDLRADQLRAAASDRGISERVRITGALRGDELWDEVRRADVFVSTSVIEGYPLALVEAQASGLPVVMYELPWLAIADGNAGMIALPQGDKHGIATVIADLANDPEGYAQVSQGSLAATRHAIGHDFRLMYEQLLTGNLPAGNSPEPTPTDMNLLLVWTTFYAERNFRIARRGSRRAELRSEEQHRRLRRELSATRNRLRYLQSGPSFRIGRLVTLAPRRLRDYLARRRG